MSVHTPEVLWAQRSSESDDTKNNLFITINIPDCTNPKMELTENSLEFSALSKYHSKDGIKYHLHIDFYKPIDTENSEQRVANGRNYFLVLRKKDLGLEYWPRLTKEKLKYHYIKTDFDKWVDEDEQEENAAADNDLMSQFGQMGGAGFPGMEQGFNPQAFADAGINLDEALPEEDDEGDEEKAE